MSRSPGPAAGGSQGPRLWTQPAHFPRSEGPLLVLQPGRPRPLCPKAFLTHYSSAETHTVFVHLPSLQTGKLRPREGKGLRGSRVISTLHNCPPFLESMKLG